MKSWLISDDDADGNANVYSLIQNLFGYEWIASFRDNDYYLCCEAVIWCGVTSSSNPVMVAGTTKTINEIFNAAHSTYLANTRLCRLPHSAYLQYNWAACTVPTIHEGEKESIEALSAVGNGYGVMKPHHLHQQYLSQ